MDEFKKIYQLLQSNYDLLESFLDLLPIGVYISSPEGEIVTINGYINKIFEYDTKDEFFQIHKNANTTFANPQTRILFLEILKNEGTITDFLVEYKTKTGKIIYVNECASLIKDLEGNPRYIIGTIEDITEKINEEKEKIETSYFVATLNEALLRLVEKQNSKENLIQALSLLGQHLNLTSINVFFSNVEHNTIYSQKELVWVNDQLQRFNINIPEIKIDYFRILPRIAKIVSSGEIYYAKASELDKDEQRVLRRFNIKSFLSIPIMSDGEFLGFILFVDSVHEREWKDYQIKLLGLMANSVGNNFRYFMNVQEISVLKSKLENVINAADIGIWEWDLRTNEVRINQKFADHIELEAVDGILNSSQIISQMSPRDMSKFRDAFNSVITGKKELFTFDFKLLGKDKWLNPLGKITDFDDKGNPIKVSGILIDITQRKLYEREIRHQNEKLNTILNTIQIQLLEIDANGTITLVSGNLLNEFGLNEQSVGSSIFDLSEELKFLQNTFVTTIDSKPLNLSVPLGDKIIDCKSQAIKSPDGDIEYVLISLYDQTIENKYRSAIEKTNQQLYAIIDSLPGPVNIVDYNFELMDSNRFLEKGFEIAKPDRITDLVNFKFCMKHSTICDIASLEKSKSTGVAVQRLTEEYEEDILGFSLMIHTQPIYNEKGEIWALAQIGLDVTELKKTQKLLSETIKTKDKFFDIIAHDLRNPINALNMLIDDLLRNYSNLSIDEIYESNVQIQKSVVVLSQLLNNLLEWSRSQTGRLKVNPDYIDTSYIVRNVVEITNDSAKIKNIEIINDIKYGTIVYSDSNMLFTIFRNLVSNAIKYTNPFGKVKIYSNELDHFVEFVVEDTGVGISPDRLDKIFSVEHVQSTPGTHKEKGSGLGLILCKEFVQRNGGDIRVESEINKGTKFIFKLPKEPLIN